MPTSAPRYLLLDTMRGVAALAVVWGHLMDSWGRQDLNGPQYILAVDFFFILSGFVIAHAYAHRMKQGMAIVDFCRVRAIRLYPLLMVGAAIGTIVMIGRQLDSNHYSLNNILATGALAMLALPGFFIAATPLAFPINGPAWSLFFELAVNFLYAFIARHLTLLRLIALVAVGAVAVAWLSLENGTIEGGWQKSGLKEGAARVTFGFFMGILLYELRPRRALPDWLGPVLLAALAICLLEPIQTNVLGQLALAIAVFPVLIWLGSAVPAGGQIAKAGAFLGALSYPLYILHWPFLDATRDLFRMIDPQSQFVVLWSLLQFALVIAIAWFAMKLIDEPVRKWLTSLFRRMPTIKSASTDRHAPSR